MKKIKEGSGRNWIQSPSYDLVFFLLPPIAVPLLIFSVPKVDIYLYSGPLWLSLAIAIFLEYGHQYSALFRTYFDREEIASRRVLYRAVPAFSFLIAIVLYQFGEVIFWRAITYLAIYHFIRQQYGFMMLYSRKEIQNKYFHWLDRAAIYAATLYPLFFEHTHMPREFDWSGVEGALFHLDLGRAYYYLFPIYACITGAYAAKEILLLILEKRINVQKNLIFIGTALSWYIGLVYFNNILIFYCAMQFCHSLPYIGLIWSYGNKKWKKQSLFYSREKLPWIARQFTPRAVLVFVGIIAVLSFLEIGLWRAFTHDTEISEAVFGGFDALAPHAKPLLALLIPLLAIPQMTHYILDAFIWRMQRGPRRWLLVLEGKNLPEKNPAEVA